MPIEVKELVIRTVIHAADEKSTSSTGNQQASKQSAAEAIEKVMELIRKKNER